MNPSGESECAKIGSPCIAAAAFGMLNSTIRKLTELSDCALHRRVQPERCPPVGPSGYETAYPIRPEEPDI